MTEETVSPKPLAGSLAATLVKDGLEEALRKDGLSMSEFTKELGYSNSVAFSQMATGRLPVPIARSIEFANRLQIPQGQFLLAVLDQHFPEIDFRGLIQAEPPAPPTAS